MKWYLNETIPFADLLNDDGVLIGYVVRRKGDGRYIVYTVDHSGKGLKIPGDASTITEGMGLLKSNLGIAQSVKVEA